MIRSLMGIACGFAAAMAISAGPMRDDPAPPADSAAVAFRRHRDEILAPGMHELDGWVFSTVHHALPDGVRQPASDRLEGRLKMRAVAQMSEARFDSVLRSTDAAPAVRLAAAEAAGRCFGGGAWSAAGVVTVMSEISGDVFVVVCALPRASLVSAQVTDQQLLNCLRSRAKDRTLNMRDAMVLREMEGSPANAASASADDVLLDALGRLHGRGISLTARRSWTLPDGSACPECFQAWSMPAARAASEGRSVRDTLVPIPKKAAQELSLEEALQLLGKRAHDPALHAAIQERLRKDGWIECAKSLDAEPLPIAQVGALAGDALPATARADLLETPLIMSMLLSGGRAQPRLMREEPADMRAVITLLSSDSADAVPRAIESLSASLAKSPSAPAAKLLAQLLIVQREPDLARALAQAAIMSSPEDGFAHLLLLRAERQRGSKDAVAALAPKVLEELALKPEWRSEVEALSAWAGTVAAPVP